MKVITTFSQDGYDLYGKNMIKSWLQHWPNSSELIVYTEGYTLEEQDYRLSERDLDATCPNLKIFKEASKLFINSANPKSRRKVDKAIRWSHKVYAISDALNIDTDYLIFLDGDTTTKNIVPPTLARDLVGNHLFAVHFETIKGMTHFETGLIAFNMRHPQMPILKRELQAGYDNLEIHRLEKPWDGFWFAHLYKKYNLDVRNLANGGVFSNPLVKNILSHDVGKEKFQRQDNAYDKYSGRKKL